MIFFGGAGLQDQKQLHTQIWKESVKVFNNYSPGGSLGVYVFRPSAYFIQFWPPFQEPIL